MHVLCLVPLIAVAHAIPHIPGSPHAHGQHARQARNIAKRQGQGRPNMTGADVWGSVNPFATGSDGTGEPTSGTGAGTGTGTSGAVPTSSAVISSEAPEPSSTVTPETSREADEATTSSAPLASSQAVSPSASSAVVSPSASSSTSTLPSPSSSSPSTSSTVSTPTTLSGLASFRSTTVVTHTVPSILSNTSATPVATPSSSSSSDASTDGQEKKSGGLSKTALIAIIVVSSVVGAVAIGWTLFRKWKLRPSNRFDEKLRPIDFSPHGGGMGDDFLEKTLQRSASNASADRQRQMLVADLDHSMAGAASGGGGNHVPGVPEHDFTAGYAGAGAGGGYGMYQSQAYDDYYAQQQSGEGAGLHDYPPSSHAHGHGHGYVQEQDGGYGGYEYPSQDATAVGGAYSDHQHQHHEGGYTDLKRGDSVGQYSHPSTAGYQQGGQMEFPESSNYLGRPTGGADGPYAQAAQYRY